MAGNSSGEKPRREYEIKIPLNSLQLDRIFSPGLRSLLTFRFCCYQFGSKSCPLLVNLFFRIYSIYSSSVSFYFLFSTKIYIITVSEISPLFPTHLQCQRNQTRPADYFSIANGIASRPVAGIARCLPDHLQHALFPVPYTLHRVGKFWLSPPPPLSQRNSL